MANVSAVVEEVTSLVRPEHLKLADEMQIADEAV